MKTNPSDYINPCVEQHPCVGAITHHGLTKREYFAALTMQGFCANMQYRMHTNQELAKWAVMSADALIAELNKEQG